MKVALIHYWLVGMRGGEKVLQSLCELFPQADIFTHVYDNQTCKSAFQDHTIYTSKINRFPFPKKLYQAYLPFMTSALEELDLSGYDLVISSEAGPAKGVIAPPDAFHLCYVHSPMRYIWDQYHEYRASASFPAKLMMPLVAPRLRQWDVTSAARVDAFVANSTHVAKRVKKYWRRDAEVVHPPVSVAAFAPVERHSESDNFYLWLGELAPYKRPDIAVEAFSRSGKRLIVIGGPDKTVRALKKYAKPNVEFLGKTDFTALKHYLSRCRALIFPGEEDFGIVPIEAMASGRPIIAYRRGGALDYVEHGRTGYFFDEQSVEALSQAVDMFEKKVEQDIHPQSLAEHAAQFSDANFKTGIIRVLNTYGIEVPIRT